MLSTTKATTSWFDRKLSMLAWRVTSLWWVTLHSGEVALIGIAISSLISSSCEQGGVDAGL